MKNETELTEDTTELRRRAEIQLASQAASIDKRTSAADSVRLIHELQVHQIELELQNEELIRARDELETSLERYTDLYDFAPVGYITLQSKGVITRANLAAASLLGMERARLAGERYEQFVSEVSLVTYNAFLNLAFASSDKHFCEVKIINNSIERLVLMEAVLLSDGRECRVILNDITDRRAIEEALRESNLLFGMLVNSLPLLFWITDDAGKTTYINQQWAPFTGHPEAEILRLGWQYLIHQEDAETVRQIFQHALNDRLAFQVEFGRLYHDKSYHWIDSRGIPRFSVDGLFLGFMGFSLDITEKKSIQAHLFEVNKMESIGRLAGGIAHDFNNLLTVILGSAELMQDSNAPMVRDDALLVNIKDAATRAADLTQQLLMYARRQMVEFSDVDINALIRDIEPLLHRALGEKYELVSSLSLEPCKVFTNPSQIGQVLMNLILNARDSMPAGGRILLKTSIVNQDVNTDKSQNDIDSKLKTMSGDYVLLTVSDSGMGMSTEVQECIFEPFYTTKIHGRGIGLGLATSYGIIMQNKGDISVESEPGKGATFKIYLPIVKGPLQPPSNILKKEVPRAAATILIVDDELQILEIAVRILKNEGYKVLQASSGSDALIVAGEWSETIDLLLTDVVMPLMGGRQLAMMIQNMHPDIQVLYMSGYTYNEIAQ